MKRIYFLGLVCIFLMICGCATVNVTKTAKGYFSATNPNEIEILMTKPERSFIELATVTTVNWPPGDTAKMHNSLRAKCAPLGANAVVLISSGINNSGLYWASGVAIRYKDQLKQKIRKTGQSRLFKDFDLQRFPKKPTHTPLFCVLFCRLS
ncbi:MAG: hypothetical protein FJZ16_08030 [Candidatus Omnitrophica bacterium]|nr:hypothetical protein [Candidatus Omnitrophota bacterium]